MRVTDLTFAHIERLRTRLDGLSSLSISGWQHLAEVLTEGDRSLKEHFKGLELHNHGGGNPALSFLNDLPKKRPLVTLGEIQVLAKQLKRNDIVHFIEENLSDKKSVELGDLVTSDKERLANYMNKSTPGINGWEMFADKYNYKYTEIKSLKATIANPCSFSPTSKLFELIQEALPDMTVDYLKNVCGSIGRNDVASIFDDILNGKT